MSIERTTIYFEKPGKEHTGEALKIALEAAREREINTVLISSTTGWTALEALKVFEGSGLKLIFVTHQTGYRDAGVQLMPAETREKIDKAGAIIYTGTDVLTGGVEVGMSRQRPPKTASQEGRLPYIVPPVSTIVANTLRLFSQGVKVCVEIAMMVADAGLVPTDRPLISVAGSHAGSDTAMVITPASSNRIRDMKLHEILVKPLL
ncbi:MAG: hypothetical protein JSV27_05260 [Candidatus Bathyarchaeota archaeon]|nr:MAG: hypothetical protein JSV27_05260 [Candidatus Bathyarchaeota archaeon]